MERIGQHSFPCILRHRSPRKLELTILRRLPAGRVHQALEGGLRPGELPQPPRSTARSLALNVGVGMRVGSCGGVMRTGGGGPPWGLDPVLRRGGARGVGAAWAYADTLMHGYGLCLGVWLGSMGAAVTGHLLDVGRHRGLVGGLERCWLRLAFLRPVQGSGLAASPGCGFWVVGG